jgi:hypothetical protein
VPPRSEGRGLCAATLMSSAQERPGSRAGTTNPTGSDAGTGSGAEDMSGRSGSTSTGATSTGAPERVGAHRGGYEAADYGAGIRGPARAGGVMLAAVLMIFSGLVTFFYGIAEVIRGTFFTGAAANYVFYFSPRGRGIVELAIGAVIFAAGVCLLLGMLWARMVGVVLAVLSALANFLFMPWYPVWSVIVIALDVFIIWALMSGGRERRFADR